jgi:hypothetical protein
MDAKIRELYDLLNHHINVNIYKSGLTSDNVPWTPGLCLFELWVLIIGLLAYGVVYLAFAITALFDCINTETFFACP